MIAYVTRRAATQEDLDAFDTAKLARDIERGRAVVLAAVNVSLGVDEDGDALGVPQPAGRVQRRLAGASVATIEAPSKNGDPSLFSGASIVAIGTLCQHPQNFATPNFRLSQTLDPSSR